MMIEIVGISWRSMMGVKPGHANANLVHICFPDKDGSGIDEALHTGRGFGGRLTSKKAGSNGGFVASDVEFFFSGKGNAIEDAEWLTFLPPRF